MSHFIFIHKSIYLLQESSRQHSRADVWWRGEPKSSIREVLEMWMWQVREWAKKNPKKPKGFSQAFITKQWQNLISNPASFIIHFFVVVVFLAATLGSPRPWRDNYETDIVPCPQCRLQSILSSLELHHVSRLQGHHSPPRLPFMLPNIQTCTREIYEAKMERVREIDTLMII